MMTRTDPEVQVAARIARRDTRPREWIALIGGIAVVLIMNSPPVDTAVDRSFSSHMLQHMILMNVAAPLIAIAWPLLFRAWSSSRIVSGLNALARPAPALILSSGALWFWHVPAIYNAQLSNGRIHAVEHMLFIGAFVLFWRPLVDDNMSLGYLKANGQRVLYLTISMLASGLLAAVLTFSGHAFYPHYAAASSGGRSPLADQQLGGAIMWLGGTIAGVLAAIITMREEP